MSLTLGDGVGGSPCDWKASKISCQKFIDAFVTSSEKEIPERMIESIRATNLEILSETGTCKNMESIFSGLEAGIKEKDVIKVEKLLAIRSENMIDFGRQNIGILISSMAKTDLHKTGNRSWWVPIIRC